VKFSPAKFDKMFEDLLQRLAEGLSPDSSAAALQGVLLMWYAGLLQPKHFQKAERVIIQTLGKEADGETWWRGLIMLASFGLNEEALDAPLDEWGKTMAAIVATILERPDYPKLPAAYQGFERGQLVVHLVDKFFSPLSLLERMTHEQEALGSMITALAHDRLEAKTN
jgi:hypothetical protein